MLRDFRCDQEQRQQMITRQRRARRIGADKAHQGAGGRIGAAAPAMRVNGSGEADQPLELTQTGSVQPAAPGLAAMPPEIERRSSSLSSDDFPGFLLDVSFELLDGFCVLVGISTSSLGLGMRSDGGKGAPRRWS
jgi:hypothetical protein